MRIATACFLAIVGCSAKDRDVTPLDAGGGSGGGAATGGFAGVGNAGGGGSAGGTGATGGGTNCTPPVPSGQCDTWPQCGCSPGLACDIGNVATGTTQCRPAGTVPPYQKCGGQSLLCITGYACAGSACKQFCNTTADCPKGKCFQVMYDDSGTSKPVPEMKGLFFRMQAGESGCRLRARAGLLSRQFRSCGHRLRRRGYCYRTGRLRRSSAKRPNEVRCGLRLFADW